MTTQPATPRRRRILQVLAAGAASVSLPSLAVIGTGKRVGKTAVTGHVARLLAFDRQRVDGGPTAFAHVEHRVESNSASRCSG